MVTASRPAASPRPVVALTANTVSPGVALPPYVSATIASSLAKAIAGWRPAPSFAPSPRRRTSRGGVSVASYTTMSLSDGSNWCVDMFSALEQAIAARRPEGETATRPQDWRPVTFTVQSIAFVAGERPTKRPSPDLREVRGPAPEGQDDLPADPRHEVRTRLQRRVLLRDGDAPDDRRRLGVDDEDVAALVEGLLSGVRVRPEAGDVGADRRRPRRSRAGWPAGTPSRSGAGRRRSRRRRSSR